mgnify:CR=1 FL=1
MKFAIKHEIKGRIRIHLAQKHMTYRQADILQCYLEKEENISKASVYVRTQMSLLSIPAAEMADSFTEQDFPMKLLRYLNQHLRIRTVN